MNELIRDVHVSITYCTRVTGMRLGTVRVDQVFNLYKEMLKFLSSAWSSTDQLDNKDRRESRSPALGLGRPRLEAKVISD